MGSILKTDLFDFVSSIIPSMEELDLELCAGVAAVRCVRVVNGQCVVIEIDLVEPIDFEQVCALEEALERELPADEVIFSQRSLETLDPDASLHYIKSATPWLVRHGMRNDRLCAAIKSRRRRGGRWHDALLA